MKKIGILIIIYILSLFFTGNNYGTVFGSSDSSNPIFTNGTTKTPYDNNDYSLEKGVEQAKLIKDIEEDGTASEYIQKIITYLISFLALISVILIIYAGFNILISGGDEEKIKKSKQIIMYSILGLFIIFLAWTITSFVITVLSQ